MISRLTSVLVIVAAMLIAVGCSRPLNVAVATANTAAESLKIERATIWARRKSDQLAAARRVEGDRSDPAVVAEQRDRVAIVGRQYRAIWNVYDVAWQAWATAARAVHAAQQLQRSGSEPDLQMIAALLAVLATAQQQLAEALSDARP